MKKMYYLCGCFVKIVTKCEYKLLRRPLERVASSLLYDHVTRSRL